jgi:hypothetical protein
VQLDGEKPGGRRRLRDTNTERCGGRQRREKTNFGREGRKTAHTDDSGDAISSRRDEETGALASHRPALVGKAVDAAIPKDDVI